ncbi:peptidoglycan editing factor PgeF [Thalassotalea litorea]|uniref:peptidoglycan editing factor PgeF n=1 Tax=Thalassotalea litorea TaxID=2020715 RepID=UPI003736CB9F
MFSNKHDLESIFSVTDSRQNLIKGASTTRQGGHSDAPFHSFNLGAHVGDNLANVNANRQRLVDYFGQPIQWLEQVHGNHVHELTTYTKTPVTADAVFTRLANQPIGVLTADCLPILLASASGTELAAIHAGWRPLVSGIVENTVQKFTCKTRNIHAWLGPCIGAQQFEVGPEVRAQFIQINTDNDVFFKQTGNGKFIGDLHGLAIKILQQLGVQHIQRSQCCTVSSGNDFFSYRRDGQTGRMATVIMKNSLAGPVRKTDSVTNNG